MENYLRWIEPIVYVAIGLATARVVFSERYGAEIVHIFYKYSGENRFRSRIKFVRIAAALILALMIYLTFLEFFS